MPDRLFADIRFALRTFVKSPTFTAAVVATIALAVGATTSIFAVVDTILLRPLPFPNSERVVRLCETHASIGDWCGASPANVADWARASSALDSAGVARREGATATIGGEKVGMPGAIVSPGFFKVLRLKTTVGRGIEDRDMARGSNQVVVITHDLWQRRFGSDPAVVGRPLVLDDKPFTIVGVLAADAYVPGQELPDAEIWRPLTTSIDDVEDRGWRGFTAIARMAAGVSAPGLVAQLDGIRARLAQAYPEANKDWGLRIMGLRESIVGDVRPTLLVFLGAVALVLLIACANVASLLLVRATGRDAEFALRASLGASRRRLVQQLVTESLLLALAGGGVGLLLADWVTSGLVAVAPANIPRLQEVSVDARVVLFALLLSAVTALLFGFAPARSAARADLIATLKGSRTSGRAAGVRPVFVVAQLSLALMLLFGAGLLARSFGRLLAWEPGFDRSNLAWTWMSPPVRTTPAAVAAMERVRDEVAALPGIRSAALCSAGPLFGGTETGGLAIEGRPAFSAKEMPTVQWFDVGPQYFDTLGVRIVRGRGFTQADAAGGVNVGIINETLARRFFAGENPLGRRVTIVNHPAEIIGVAADIKPLEPNRPTPPQMYWPIRQYPRLGANLLLRTAPGVSGIEKTVRARIGAVNADMQVSRFFTLDERMARSLVSPRFNMVLVGGFALVALLLAAVGVYGVIAYAVASRTRELGVRIALGATPGELVAGVVRRGMGLAMIGVAAGCLGALAIGRLLTSLLYGLPPSDPLALSAAVVVLALVAAVASWLPARRASRVDPVSALRAQ